MAQQQRLQHDTVVFADAQLAVVSQPVSGKEAAFE